MTPEEKSLVRSSFAEMMKAPDRLASCFYGRLFELDPSVRAMFTIDITRQGIKFMEMMQTIIDCMDRLDNLVPLLWPMGKRHGGYGVRHDHYGTVGSALIWAMEQQAGGQSSETLAAWGKLYAIMAAAMEQAAKEENSPIPL